MGRRGGVVFYPRMAGEETMKKAAPCSDPEGCAEAAGTLGDMATGPNPRTAPFAGRLRPSRRASASPSRGAAPLSNRVLSAGGCGQSRRPRRHSHSGAAGQAPACGVGRWVLAADSMSSSHYRLSLPMTSSWGESSECSVPVGSSAAHRQRRGPPRTRVPGSHLRG